MKFRYWDLKQMAAVKRKNYREVGQAGRITWIRNEIGDAIMAVSYNAIHPTV